MHKLYVPVSLANFSPERIDQLRCELARAGAQRVFVTAGRSIMSQAEKDDAVSRLKTAVLWLKENGYEPAVWISSLGHGGNTAIDRDYQHIIAADGSRCADSFCPLDERFCEEFARYVADLATTGVDMIMLDDDYRLGYRTGNVGCFCPLHVRDVSRRLGREVTAEDILSKGLSGKPNPIRDAWLDSCGESLRALARRLRAAVDSVDPAIRLGHCAVLDTWDIDGVDSITLARDFAGNTKPFLRLIGAAYWGPGNNFGCNIANVIELERMQLSWCEGQGIETFYEGDVFPRPRHHVPAAYLEALDTALRADGRINGGLKYMLDYETSPFYERGYIDRHERNAALAADFSRIFAGKRHAGVRIYEHMRRLRDYDLGDPCPGPAYIARDFVSTGARLLCDNSVPMQYDEEDVTVVFGENARHVPEQLLSHGAILDAVAARLLHERGIDVGLSSIKGPFMATRVDYPSKGEGMGFRSGMYGTNSAFCLLTEPLPSAEPLCVLSGEGQSACAYRYEDAAGRRFLVFPFIAKRSRTVSMLFRNYYMQSLLFENIGWIRRRPLDICISKCPDLYVQTAKSENELAIGLWNMYADAAFFGEVPLGESWREAEFYNCSGRLCGNSLQLDDLGAFSFGAVLLKK